MWALNMIFLLGIPNKFISGKADGHLLPKNQFRKRKW